MKPNFRSLFVSFALVCFCSGCVSDENRKKVQDPESPPVKKAWQKWISKNSFSIQSPSAGNHDEFEFLQELIQERALVQLGESSHGVKEFNQIRVRIIKYLHEMMGFNVIAFESGLFECYHVNNTSSAKSPRQMMESIFSVWKTEEVLELFEYIESTRKTANPLILAGFDFQMSGSWTERSLMLREMITLLDPDFARDLFITDTLFAKKKKPNDIVSMRKYVIDNQGHLQRIYAHLEELIDEHMPELTLKYQADPLDPLFAHQIAVSMLRYIDFWLDEENEMAIRDKAMAENVDFLKQVAYPGEKIIIWAHNLHIRHHNFDLDQDPYNKIKSMGSWLHERYPEEIYTIGLYMYKGKAAYTNREIYTIESHTPSSLESILHSAGHDLCFVDLKHPKTVSGNDWMVSEILTKTWGIDDLRMIPANQYDAILLVDSVSPPDYLD